MPYAFRHNFATGALARGVPVAVLAELMNTSVKMVQQTYGHLADVHEPLREALAIIRPAGAAPAA